MSEAKRVHDLDQAFAAIASVAAQCARFYAALIEEGMPEDKATSLTAAYLQQMLAYALKGDSQ